MTPWSRPARPTLCLLASLTMLGALASCKNRQTLGPADAYVLLAPKQPPQKSPAGFPIVEKMDLDDGKAVAVTRLLGDGFAVEMVRTVHLAKQLVRGPGFGGQKFPAHLVQSASEPLALVVGWDSEFPQSKGLAFKGLVGAPEERPHVPWIGLPITLEDDRALVQTLSGRLAAHAAGWVASIGSDPSVAAGPDRPPLIEAYRMAMEVIAREWRVGRGPAGALPSTAGSVAQRHMFADIRENKTPFAEAGDSAPGRRAAAGSPGGGDGDLPAGPDQDRGQRRRPAGDLHPVRAGAAARRGQRGGGAGTGAQLQRQAVLGLGAGRAGRSSTRRHRRPGRSLRRAVPPGAEGGAAHLPGHHLRRHGQAGGISRKPEEATAALAEVAAIIDDVVAGKRSLRDAL